MVDVLAVPERLEEAVREAEDEEVLDRLLAEVVIDPEDLRLVEGLADGVVQDLRALEIVPEGLLDDDARPRSSRIRRARRRDQTCLLEVLHDHAELGRRDREIEEAVFRRPALGVEVLEVRAEVGVRLRVLEGAGDVADASLEVLPQGGVDGLAT